jgi:hypothetical protein
MIYKAVKISGRTSIALTNQKVHDRTTKNSFNFPLASQYSCLYYLATKKIGIFEVTSAGLQKPFGGPALSGSRCAQT